MSDEESADLLDMATTTMPYTQRTSASTSVWLSPPPTERHEASSLAEDATVLASLSNLPATQSRRLPDWLAANTQQLKELAAEQYRALAEERHNLRESFTQEFVGASDHDDERAVADAALPSTLARLAPLVHPSQAAQLPHAVSLPVGGRVICFDIETTGFAQEDCIIEIGACEVIDGQLTGLLFQSYASPTVPIHPAAEAVHGLSLADVAFEPPLSAVLASFVEFVGDSPLVAHNMAFDRRFVVRALEQRGMQLLNPMFCTMQAYRRLYPGERFSLEAAIARASLARKLRRFVAHSALDDARAVAALYAHLTNQEHAKRGEFASMRA
jgi:DNA polymerase-3 subunit epsilon